MPTQEMLPVAQALSLILDDIRPLPSEKIELGKAVGRVLAQDAVAESSMPPFANSSMDGYAVRSADTAAASRENPVLLEVTSDIAAGQVSLKEIASGQAARIMTGAPMPVGADAVVPVEQTSEPWRGAERPLPDTVAVYQPSRVGDYVRFPGEDIKPGDIVVKSGQILRPQEIGVLAALGIGKVEVIRKPRIAILATGDELVDINEDLEPGKIRNSNGPAQAAQVIQLGAEVIDLGVAADSIADVEAKLNLGLETGADLFISSAGVSVGAHDVVKSVLEDHGIVKIWRIRMRPGKPLVFALYKNRPYLGLPGNPVSAMVTFEIFARPVILKMSGHKKLLRSEISVVVEEDIESDGRESYIRAQIRREADGYKAVTTGKQGSHLLTSLVEANGLLIIPEGATRVQAGDVLNAIMLDWPESVF